MRFLFAAALCGVSIAHLPARSQQIEIAPTSQECLDFFVAKHLRSNSAFSGTGEMVTDQVCKQAPEGLLDTSEALAVAYLVETHTCVTLRGFWLAFADDYRAAEPGHMEKQRLLSFMEQSGDANNATADRLRQEVEAFDAQKADFDEVLGLVDQSAQIKACYEPSRSRGAEQRDALDDFLFDAESTFASERQTRIGQDPMTQEQWFRTPKGTVDSVRYESILYSQIYSCWDGVNDQPNPEALNVSLQIRLEPDGSIKTPIRLIEPVREPLGRSPMRVAIERARRAVQKCAPYELPSEDYAVWNTMTVNLGPRFSPGRPF